MKPIVVVGSANIDLVAPVERLPVAGETLMGADLVTVFGGKGANQAVAAARLGGHVEFVGCLGNDSHGAEYLAYLETEGIGTSRVARSSGHPTGVALILVDRSGQNSIVVCPGANHALSRREVEEAGALIESAAAVVMQFEIPMDTVLRVLDLAARSGVPVILNPSPVRHDFDLAGKPVAILIVNEVEAEVLSGCRCADEDSAMRAAATLATKTGGRVIVTRGGDGTVVHDGRTAQVVPAARIGRVVDTVGAGDTFAGALAVAVTEGLDLASAARFANCAAGIATTRMGAQSSMPSRAELAEFMKTGAAQS